MARLAATGVLLFGFIPLVLFLYLRQPLGPAPSIVVGLVIMFGHRFVAAPWMMRHAKDRCLWCAGGARTGVALEVQTGGRQVSVVGCSRKHADCASRFLTLVDRWRVLIGIGIFVPLVVLLVGSLARAAGYSLLPHEWNIWQFRTIVAATVVVTSVAWHAVGRPYGSLRSPFPLHNLFLLGIRNTLWVFRIVGAWWILTGVLELVWRV